MLKNNKNYLVNYLNFLIHGIETACKNFVSYMGYEKYKEGNIS
jgi:hypothetical protein